MIYASSGARPQMRVVVGPGGRLIIPAPYNIAETGARLADLGATLAEVRRSIDLMAVEIVPFDEAQAHAAAGVRAATRRYGLPLGDRACLQLAARNGLPALTADRAWAALDVGIEVRLIRS